MQITVYSRSNCPQCDLTKNFLKSRGIGYKEIDVRAPGNEGHREFIINNGFRSMPVVDAGDGNIWGAHDIKRLEALALQQEPLEEVDLLTM